jgi:hypothetical protein
MPQKKTLTMAYIPDLSISCSEVADSGAVSGLESRPSHNMFLGILEQDTYNPTLFW